MEISEYSVMTCYRGQSTPPPPTHNAEQQFQLLLSDEMDNIPTESTQKDRFVTSSEETFRELENVHQEATTVKQTTTNFTVHNTYQTYPIILYILKKCKHA